MGQTGEDGGAMKIFGRTLGEYVRFEAGLLALIVVVGLLRFGLYQAAIYPSGAPDARPGAPPEVVASYIRWLSMNAVLVLGALTLGYVTHRRAFGGYKHLLPLNLLLGIVSSWISAAGVLVAIVFHVDTIYSRPEFSGHVADGKTATHVLAHVFVGPILIAIAGWMLSAIVMLITRPRPKKVRPLPAEATPAPAPVDTPTPETPPTAPSSESAPAVE
jgi:hypothetical protein